MDTSVRTEFDEEELIEPTDGIVVPQAQLQEAQSQVPQTVVVPATADSAATASRPVDASTPGAYNRRGGPIKTEKVIPVKEDPVAYSSIPVTAAAGAPVSRQPSETQEKTYSMVGDVDRDDIKIFITDTLNYFNKVNKFIKAIKLGERYKNSGIGIFFQKFEDLFSNLKERYPPSGESKEVSTDIRIDLESINLTHIFNILRKFITEGHPEETEGHPEETKFPLEQRNFDKFKNFYKKKNKFHQIFEALIEKKKKRRCCCWRNRKSSRTRRTRRGSLLEVYLLMKMAHLTKRV